LVRSGDFSRFAAKRRLKPLLRTLLKFLPSTDGAMRHGRLAMTLAPKVKRGIAI
jgi:hypothetical protein